MINQYHNARSIYIYIYVCVCVCVFNHLLYSKPFNWVQIYDKY